MKNAGECCLKKHNFKMMQTDLICSIHQTPLYKISDDQKAICKQCEIEKRIADEKKHQQNSAHEFLKNKIRSIQMPERHKACRFKNFNISIKGQGIAYSQVVQYSKDVLSGKRSNILLFGKVGTGKTHLACSTAVFLVSNNKTVRYITSDDLATEIMQSWDRKDQTEKSVISSFTDLDLLIIDEYGLHDLTNKKKLELIQKVLNSRYENMKPVMIISNLDTEQVKSTIGDRNWSRLQQDGFKNISFNWYDYRSHSISLQSIAGE